MPWPLPGAWSGASRAVHSGWLRSLPFWTLLHNQVVKGSLGWFRYSFRETVVAQWSVSLHPRGLEIALSEETDKSGVGIYVFQGEAASRAICHNTLMQSTFTF